MMKNGDEESHLLTLGKGGRGCDGVEDESVCIEGEGVGGLGVEKDMDEEVGRDR